MLSMNVKGVGLTILLSLLAPEGPYGGLDLIQVENMYLEDKAWVARFMIPEPRDAHPESARF